MNSLFSRSTRSFIRHWIVFQIKTKWETALAFLSGDQTRMTKIFGWQISQNCSLNNHLESAWILVKNLTVYTCVQHVKHRRRNRQNRRQRSSLLFGGRSSFNSLPLYRFSTRMIWRKGCTGEWMLVRMDASEKWMIIWFTSHHTKPHPPKIDVLPKHFFKSSLLLNVLFGIQVRLPNSSDDISLLFCLFLLL